MAPLYVIAFLSSLGFSLVAPFLVYLVTRFGGNAFAFASIGAAFWRSGSPASATVLFARLGAADIAPASPAR